MDHLFYKVYVRIHLPTAFSTINGKNIQNEKSHGRLALLMTFYFKRAFLLGPILIIFTLLS
ncbi:hypothetical protein AJ85_04435 [Alkalihalobacillus alcalophilus ATCC 27647 = CGMCC 1.3604]|uniref:Uncharacterized protein n=1 Tax=Alkalihalobacillus alcalophilus ATCC 27647 = CGMCC 1.3604 TaxID=1218173 RepID=A0A094WHM0_ALKAL|nr:hypothetical protein BALCAV_0211260 [Alkalihalobacillus alcalophilus ATCC 27647 = CGMCC 1.3604]THG91533.1 hypothetical protein AJ85_04435 [Alkalihalobacillus alcalophilus ATCC 27647 = CGMCC 1.3604]